MREECYTYKSADILIDDQGSTKDHLKDRYCLQNSNYQMKVKIETHNVTDNFLIMCKP